MHTYAHTPIHTYDIIYVPSFIHPLFVVKLTKFHELCIRRFQESTAVWHSAGLGWMFFFKIDR